MWTRNSNRDVVFSDKVTKELEQKEVMRELLQANYAGRPFTFPSGYLFAPQLMGAAMDGVSINDVKMPSADLRFCSMTRAHLKRVDLSSARAQEIGWSGSILEEVSLYRGLFSHAVARETRFLRCRLERSFFDSVAGENSHWEGCTGDKIVFDNSHLRGAVFQEWKTSKTSFMESDLRDVLFVNCHFQDADFSLSCLNGACFKDCLIENCSFSGCVGVGLSFQESEVRETYLSPNLLATCRKTPG